ncbi:structural protein P5 [Pseudomonas viridiflava]|uniref:structural protein P5 n=1 Tax=Pseudomonas viridiflava TaxID=33069 RepID=UPI000F013D95|nr:structural protein P5 [Pseudomonas viridiflava]
MKTPRGIRNNNPGNIDFNPRNQWEGQLPHDPAIEARFARFDTPENGIRAMGKLIINYRGKDGLPGVGGPGIDTVYEIINRWAPMVENNTPAYVRAVADTLGIDAKAPIRNIRDRRTLTVLLIGIMQHENGDVPYTTGIVDEGIRRALA